MDYVIGDLHLGHKRICEFEPIYRPFASVEEHDAEIIRRWNSTVSDTDKIYVMGDVFFRKENIEQAKQLRGRKILILGNHDVYVSMTIYATVFERIYGVLAYGDCVMTHIPVHPSQFERYTFNIHGHVHSKSLEDQRYINVSAEVQNLTPVPLKELIESRGMVI